MTFLDSLIIAGFYLLTKGVGKTYNDGNMSLMFIEESEEFQQLLRTLDKDTAGVNLTGLIEPAKPYFLAALIQNVEKKVILIRPAASSLYRFRGWCRFFLSIFSSPAQVLHFPPLSENPYQDVPPSLDAVSTRMEFFYKLKHQRPELIVTSLLGLLKPFPSVPSLQTFFLELEKGSDYVRDDLLEKLDAYGYELEEITNSHGEFARRGGIVDIFSPWQAYPFRIEFSGDKIVSLREFDPATQRSLRRLESLVIPALREFSGSQDFLQEWKSAAGQKAGTLIQADLAKKQRDLANGDFYPAFTFHALAHKDRFVPFTQYLDDYLFIIDEYEVVSKEWKETTAMFQEQYEGLVSRKKKFALPPEDIFSPDLWAEIGQKAIRMGGLDQPWSDRSVSFDFSFQSVPKFENRIPFFLQHIEKLQEERERCYIFISNQAVRKKLSVLLAQNQIPFAESIPAQTSTGKENLLLLLGDIPRGFHQPALKVSVFAESDILTEERVLIRRPRIKPFVSNFRDLKAGDYVVHTDYGIGLFNGLIKMKVDSQNQEFIQLSYKDEDKLFVPMEDLNLVQKYSKVGAAAPSLSKLGTPNWERTKARTKEAIESMATELLELYAQRKAVKGHSFSQKGTWQSEFEKTFEYVETEDQAKAIASIMEDMEAEAPMDRLLCGDVGYGKTEVAVRAAFKAVMDGKQVAVLCPTTILANQHLKTFRNRMVLFPVRVEGLSRLLSRGMQKSILAELNKGLVDVVIGTHRLISQDVRFRDLGLLIIDEEQRFGVKHKEKIKHLKANIDVMTMTATPIPRTLNMSLTGLRDISLIETPPRDRLSIHTVVTPFSRELITSSIKKELVRGGQVYFIHNRVEDIDSMAAMIQNWVPQAKVVVSHGQLPGVTLEKRMIDFIQQKYNVLVSTTIIENGIDIPLVNTLIVNRADRFGLAQLYQLRGRVGRSSRQAVAYFLVPSLSELTPLARERLKALKEFSVLGSGFRLAAKDLEIRGSGNFLGSQQHGYMEAVGFDYYMYLLEKTIKRLKGEAVEDVQSKINLKIDIRIPDTYLPQVNLRLNLYKRISSVEELDEIEKIKEEVRDRYGPLPHSVNNLFGYGTIKFLAGKLKIKAIDRVGRKLVFKFFPESPANLSLMTRLLQKYSGNITPQGIMSLQLVGQGSTEVLRETISILKELSLI